MGRRNGRGSAPVPTPRHVARFLSSTSPYPGVRLARYHECACTRAAFRSFTGAAPRVVGISQDSSVVFTADQDGTVLMWSTATGQIVQTFRSPVEPSVLSIAVTPDLQFVIVA